MKLTWARSIVFCAAFQGALLSAAHAETLSFRFEDQAGDPRDGIDATSVELSFDNETGAFTVEVTADPSAPFDGQHLLYLSVFNPDADSLEPEVSFLRLVRFDVSSDGPTIVQQRTGVASVLTHWKRGDRVASYDVLGVPAGFEGPFHSVLGGNTASFADSDEILDVALIVPEPGTWAPLVSCVGLLMFHTWCVAAQRRPS